MCLFIFERNKVHVVVSHLISEMQSATDLIRMNSNTFGLMLLMLINVRLPKKFLWFTCKALYAAAPAGAIGDRDAP